MSASRELLDAGASARLPAGHSLRVVKPSFPAPLPAVSASSAALRARLDAFLPAFKQANADLERRVAQQGGAAVDIEAVDEAKPYILMDVALTSEAPPTDSDSDDDGDGSDGAGARGVGSAAVAPRVRLVEEADGGAALTATSSRRVAAGGEPVAADSVAAAAAGAPRQRRRGGAPSGASSGPPAAAAATAASSVPLHAEGPAGGAGADDAECVAAAHPPAAARVPSKAARRGRGRAS